MLTLFCLNLLMLLWSDLLPLAAGASGLDALKQQSRRSQQDCADNIREELRAKLTQAMELVSKKGASIWVVALPTAEHNFTLHKRSFQETLCLHYAWESSRMPSHCVCSCNFLVKHALSCPRGALPSIRHNDMGDLTANLLTEVCPNVTIEPDLQPLTRETLNLQLWGWSLFGCLSTGLLGRQAWVRFLWCTCVQPFCGQQL